MAGVNYGAYGARAMDIAQVIEKTYRKEIDRYRQAIRLLHSIDTIAQPPAEVQQLINLAIRTAEGDIPWQGELLPPPDDLERGY